MGDRSVAHAATLREVRSSPRALPPAPVITMAGVNDLDRDAGRAPGPAVAQALGRLLSAIDLPALVAGSACVAALLLPLVGEGRVTPPTSLARLVPFGALAWAAGLVCCAGGRQLRRAVTGRMRPRHERIVRALEAHGLQVRGLSEADDPLGLSRCAGPARMLDRLEALAREEPALRGAARQAERMDARVAAHDGLAAAALVAAGVAWLVPIAAPGWPLPWRASLTLGALAALASVLSWVEAHALERRRVDQLVAAVGTHLALRRAPRPQPARVDA